MKIGRIFSMKLGNKISVLREKLRRTTWPKDNGERSNKVAIMFVSYNTLELTKYLLFSLFSTLNREQIATIIAVDNNSTDGSSEFLAACADHGLIEAILNRKQHYHGFALNQAINHLANQARKKGKIGSHKNDFNYIWVLDSDVIILRPDTLDDASRELRRTQSAMVGEFQYDALPDGYAHVSSLLIDPQQAWQKNIAPFDNSGAPARGMHLSLRKDGKRISDFPFRRQNYLLHLARGTLKSIIEKDDRNNVYFDWASSHCEHHFHGNPEGQAIFDEFKARYASEIGNKNQSEIIEYFIEIFSP